VAKNVIIKTKNALDIDRKVERVLRDLGNPEPPLDLEVVRELLKLDLEYYTAKDPGGLVVSFFSVRCMRSCLPFCCGSCGRGFRDYQW